MEIVFAMVQPLLVLLFGYLDGDSIPFHTGAWQLANRNVEGVMQSLGKRTTLGRGNRGWRRRGGTEKRPRTDWSGVPHGETAIE